jgi:hypothetical protein
VTETNGGRSIRQSLITNFGDPMTGSRSASAVIRHAAHHSHDLMAEARPVAASLPWQMDYGGTFEPDYKLREVLALSEPGLMEWRGEPAGRSSPGTHRSTSREIYRSPEQVMPWPSSWTNL